MTHRREAVLRPFVENKDYMDARVQAGINTHRKGYARLCFVDRAGNPLDNVHVNAVQRTHDFKFGCTLFLLDEMETEEKNQAYREIFPTVFNQGILPFYWKDLEPEQGHPRYARDSRKIYRRPAPDLCVEYCQQHGLHMKGHCIVYDSFAPQWLPREIAGIKAAYERHMAELAARYAGVIPEWDVINETLLYDIYDPRMTPLFREDDYVEWAFACARRYFKNNTLFINEAGGGIWGDFRGSRSPYYMQLELLRAHGVPFDRVGLQAHSFFRREDEERLSAGRYDPQHVFDTMDYYGRVAPLHVSEVTFPAYNGDQEDEEIQAEILRNMYRMWFSHEKMEAIVYWNLVDGYTHVANGGSWNENYYGGGLLHHDDLSEKPAFTALKQLITKEWHTTAALDSGSTSHVTLNGFYGLYDITAVHDGHTVTQTIHLAKCMDREHTIVI